MSRSTPTESSSAKPRSSRARRPERRRASPGKSPARRTTSPWSPSPRARASPASTGRPPPLPAHVNALEPAGPGRDEPDPDRRRWRRRVHQPARAGRGNHRADRHRSGCAHPRTRHTRRGRRRTGGRTLPGVGSRRPRRRFAATRGSPSDVRRCGTASRPEDRPVARAQTRPGDIADPVLDGEQHGIVGELSRQARNQIRESSRKRSGRAARGLRSGRAGHVRAVDVEAEDQDAQVAADRPDRAD